MRHEPRSPAIPAPWPDEMALRQAVRARDPGAWQEVSDRWGEALRRQASALLSQDMDPENAVAETWYLGVRAAGTYDPDQPLFGWLATICARVCLRQRRRHVELIVRARALWVRDRVRPGAAGFEGGTIVRRAVAWLPAREALTVTLRFIFGLSNAEVALALDDTPAAVRQRMGRALRRLRDGPFGEQLGRLLEGAHRSHDE